MRFSPSKTTSTLTFYFEIILKLILIKIGLKPRMSTFLETSHSYVQKRKYFFRLGAPCFSAKGHRQVQIILLCLFCCCLSLPRTSAAKPELDQPVALGPEQDGCAQTEQCLAKILLLWGKANDSSYQSGLISWVQPHDNLTVVFLAAGTVLGVHMTCS